MLKSRKYDVRHVIYSDTIEKLDEYISDFVNRGYIILDTKLIQADHYNRIYTVFYILAKQEKSIE